MFKKFAVVALGFIIAGATLTGCADVEKADIQLEGSDGSSVSVPEEDNGSGVGITYGGKPGFDLGDGLILPFDGSGLGVGYGF